MAVALSQTWFLSAFNTIRDGATSREGGQQLTKQQQRLVMMYLVILLVRLLSEWAIVFKPTLENREVSRVVFRNVR